MNSCRFLAFLRLVGDLDHLILTQPAKGVHRAQNTVRYQGTL
jgi:hypothetical protein